jgi:pyruvate,water dikinase
MNTAKQDNYVRWFEDLNSEDVGLVGGKNASLGEMVGALKNKNILVPDGFATTTKAYRAFIKKISCRTRSQNCSKCISKKRHH